MKRYLVYAIVPLMVIGLIISSINFDAIADDDVIRALIEKYEIERDDLITERDGLQTDLDYK